MYKYLVNWFAIAVILAALAYTGALVAEKVTPGWGVTGLSLIVGALASRLYMGRM